MRQQGFQRLVSRGLQELPALSQEQLGQLVQEWSPWRLFQEQQGRLVQVRQQELEFRWLQELA